MSDVESDDEETQPSREPPPLLLKLETTAGCSYIQQGTIPAQSFLAPYSMPSQFPISSGIMLPPSNVVSTTSTPRDSGIAYFPSIQSLSQSSLIPPESVKVENINVNGSVIPVYIPLSTASLGSTNSTEYCQPSMMLPFATKDRPLHQGIPSGVEGSARAPFFPPAIWQGTKLVPLSSAEHISQQSAGLPFSPSLLYSDRNSGTPAPTHLPPLVTRPYIQPILKHKQMTSAYSHHEPNRRDAQDSSELSRSSDSQRQSTVHKLVEVPIPLIGVSSSSSLPYQTASTVIPTGHENYNHNTSVPLPKSVMRSSIESYPAVLPRYIVPEHVQVKEKGTINTDAPKKKSVSSMEQFLRSKLQEPNTSSPVDVEDSIQAQIKSEPHLSSFCNFFKASKHSKYLRMRLLNTRGSANIVKWIEVTRSTSHIDDTSGPVDVVRILVSSNGLCKFQLIFPCSRTFFTRFVPSTQTLADDLLNNLSEEHVLCPGLVDFEADVISLGYQPAIVRLATTRSMKRYEHEKCEGWHIPTHYKIHSESNMAARHMCKPCKSLYHTVKQTLTKVSNTRHDCSSDSSASSLVSPSPTKTLSLLSPRGKFPHFDNVRRARKGKRKGLSKQKGSDAMDTGEHFQTTSSPITPPLAGQVSSGSELDSHDHEYPFSVKHARTGSSTSSYSPDIRYIPRDAIKDTAALATVHGLTNSITDGSPSSESVIMLAKREGSVFKFPVEMGTQSTTHAHVPRRTQTLYFESGDASSPSPPTTPLDHPSPNDSHIIIRNSTAPFSSYMDSQRVRSPQECTTSVQHRNISIVEFRPQMFNRDIRPNAIAFRESSRN